MRYTRRFGLTVLLLAVLGAGLAVADPPIDKAADHGARPGHLPAGWSLCTNPARGYAIGYPGGWHAERRGARDSCRLFDPRPFYVPRNSEPPYVRLEVWPEELPFRSKHHFAPRYWRVHSREHTSVAGRRALRVTATATGEGLAPRGMRVYAYVIDRGGRGFVVQTTGPPGRPAKPSTVDTAVRTLRFLNDSAKATESARRRPTGPIQGGAA